MSRGITSDSASKTLMLVALQAPVIDNRHLACSVLSLSAGPKPFVPILFGECQWRECTRKVAVRFDVIVLYKTKGKAKLKARASTASSASDTSPRLDLCSSAFFYPGTVHFPAVQ